MADKKKQGFKEKYRNAEYKASDIWQSRYDFITSCLSLKVPMAHWSSWTLLNICTDGNLFICPTPWTYIGHVAEQQDKLDAHMVISSLQCPLIYVVFVYLLSSLLLCACRNWFFTMCSLVLFPVQCNIYISVFSSFCYWPLMWADINEVGTIVTKSTIPNYINEVWGW
jgi:hypothetical protein